MQCVWVLWWQSKPQSATAGNQLQQDCMFYRLGMSLPMGLAAVHTACLSGILSDRKMSLHQVEYVE